MSSIVTVQQGATSRRFIEPSYVRMMLGLDVSDITDARLDALIEGACAFVENWCNRRGEMFYEVVSETFRLNQPASNLYLSRSPVVSVTSVSDGDTALATTDWEIDYDTGRLARLDGANGLQKWGGLVSAIPFRATVMYGAGYFADDDTGGNVPADLRDGTLALIRSNWFSLDRDPFTRSEEVPGVATISYGFGAAAQNNGMPPDAEALLAPYRRLALA